MRLPRPLQRDDLIALISPSSPVAGPEGLRQAYAMVESLGFRAQLGAHADAHHGYLAGSDEQRLRDLHAAFAAPEVQAVWCVRGGYGALRLLDGLDWDLLARHPKPLLGYSDATALSLAFWKQLGWPTFHGPVASFATEGPAGLEIQRALTHAGPLGSLAAPEASRAAPGQPSATDLVALVDGAAEGVLLGGNLALVTRLLGTPYFPDLSGAILFLEDVGEAAYRIDGMLTQLRLAGVLDGVAGIALGRFTDVPRSATRGDFAIEEVLRDRLVPLGVPLLSGLRIGHFADQATLPVGCRVRLDAAAGTLEAIESPWAARA